MTYRILLLSILLALSISSCSSRSNYPQQENDKSVNVIKEKLGQPFGTLQEMEVEVFDGDSLKIKGYTGVYLFKIKAVGNKLMGDTIIMEFQDDTGNFPNGELAFRKQLNAANTDSVLIDNIEEMKQEYVGRVFKVIAYETGEFTGTPEEYFDYQEEFATQGFHFKNYLVVVAELSRTK